MAPFSAFSSSNWVTGPAQLQRYNGVPAMEIQGQAAPGKSSGAAIKEIQTLLAKLPKGIGYEWTGVTYQEQLSGQQGPFLIGFSLLVVFLCLAALYESWSIPAAVMMIVPLGVFRRPRRGEPARVLQRRLFPGRPADHDRPLGQECDPDRAVRRRGGEERRERPRRGDGSRAPPSEADPDDLAGVHRGGVSAGDLQRRRRGQPERHRHRRDRRRDRGDRPGDLLRPAVLCRGCVTPSAGAARPVPSSRSRRRDRAPGGRRGAGRRAVRLHRSGSEIPPAGSADAGRLSQRPGLCGRDRGPAGGGVAGFLRRSQAARADRRGLGQQPRPAHRRGQYPDRAWSISGPALGPVPQAGRAGQRDLRPVPDRACRPAAAAPPADRASTTSGCTASAPASPPSSSTCSASSAT